jgi:hypothetical protein
MRVEYAVFFFPPFLKPWARRDGRRLDKSIKTLFLLFSASVICLSGIWCASILKLRRLFCTVGPPQQSSCRHFRFDPYGDHLQTCQNQSATLPAHDWVVYRLSLMFRSIGHCVKVHKITPAVGMIAETLRSRITLFFLADKTIVVKTTVVLSWRNIQNQRSCVIVNFTITHDHWFWIFTMSHDRRYGRSNLHPTGKLTHTPSSKGAPHTDGVLKNEVRIKIIHYRRLYSDREDPIVFIPLATKTSGHLYDDFLLCLFLHSHGWLVLWPENYGGSVRFLHVPCGMTHLKGSVGLVLVKVSGMRVSIPSTKLSFLHTLSNRHMLYFHLST